MQTRTIKMTGRLDGSVVKRPPPAQVVIPGPGIEPCIFHLLLLTPALSLK